MQQEVDRGQREALQEQLIRFVRAFGLHQPDRTPCGQPVPVSEAHALSELAGLGEGETLTQSELCRRLHLEKGTVSRLVAQLVARGWVESATHLQDRRRVHLALSPAGRQAAGELAAARTAKFDRLLEAIPASDRAKVLRALTTLTEALR